MEPIPIVLIDADARVLAAARRAARRIVETAPPPLARPAPGGDEWFAEVLIDEAGSPPGLTVGGLVAVYPRAFDLPALADMLLAGVIARKARGESEKDALRRELLSSLRGLNHGVAREPTAAGAAVVPFWLANSRGWGTQLPGLIDPLRDLQLADNLHREMTRTAIELGLFWIAEAFVPRGARVTANVRVATRVRRLEEYPGAAGNPAVQDRLEREAREWWGESVPTFERGPHAGKKFVRVIQPTTPRGLVEDVAREYAGTRFDPRIEVARAFKLDRGPPDHPTALHLLADPVVGQEPAVRAANPLVSLHVFRAEFGPALLDLLGAGRLARRGLRPEALAAAVAFDQPDEVTDLLLAELAGVARGLTATEFLRFADLLALRPD